MSLATKLTGVRDVSKFDNWLQLLVWKLFFRSENPGILRLKEIRILANHGEVGTLYNCLFSDMYASFLKNINVGKNPVVFDIGGNIGGFILLLLKMNFLPSRIVSVEMNPKTYERLWFNVRRNFEGPANILLAAVAGKKSIETLFLGHGSSGDNLEDAMNKNDKLKSYLVPFETIDEIYKKNFLPKWPLIDIIKIDIEGAEYDIFLKSKHYQCLKKCRFLIIEIHKTSDIENQKNLLRRITDLGFKQELNKSSHQDVFFFRNSRFFSLQD